jgi:hypothetical protein
MTTKMAAAKTQAAAHLPPFTAAMSICEHL